MWRQQSVRSERSGQTMASPENLGSLYLSAAALALETVGLEMITGLALSKARLRGVSSRPACGDPACY